MPIKRPSMITTVDDHAVIRNIYLSTYDRQKTSCCILDMGHL